MYQTLETAKQAEQMAEALGVSLFTTDLHMPDYPDVCVGRWKLTRTGFCLDRGYHSGLWGVHGMPVLMRDSSGNGENWETWMSLSPHEIESQEPGCRYAHGHTAVMGLGMGWVAVNIAINPAVRRVTVVERDPEVIELFDQSRVLDGLAVEIAGKIHVVRADALEWQPDEAVDFLYADIWRCLEEPQTLDDVRRMQINVRAAGIYFWGQELTIHALADTTPEACAGGREWTEAVLRCVTDTIALPLLLPEEFDYPGMIATVVRRRRERWPSSVKSEVPPAISLRPITDGDPKFLFQLYASTRGGEQALFGMNDVQWEGFLRMQFNLQHNQYMQNYDNPSFDIIMLGDAPAGRLYVNRAPEEIRVIDISLLPEHRGRGIGTDLMRRILQEGDDTGIPVTLHVEKNNPALALYQRLGFRIEADRGVSWFMERSPCGGVAPVFEQQVAAGPA